MWTPHDFQRLPNTVVCQKSNVSSSRKFGVNGVIGENKTGNGNFVCCQDIQQLLEGMSVEGYLPGEWRLFVDSNKKCKMCSTL